jgi:para-aminobenzoate synthetase component 1
MKRDEAINTMNLLGAKRSPFFFMIDFEMKTWIVETPESAFQKGIRYDFNGVKNFSEDRLSNTVFSIRSNPPAYEHYLSAFGKVMHHLQRGNSYLVNLTFPSRLEINAGLESIFSAARAKYRLLFDEHFVVFSPESFVQIKGERIATFPMKGTIDASLPNAAQQLLNNQKEQAEHATIVDLLRNDLSRVASQVKVERFRYIDPIFSSGKNLLQVSSEISGQLLPDFHQHLGTLLCDLLPAGSVSGAPKDMTLKIIKEAEGSDRGFYTGIAGVFDGQTLDSCVLIRYIEKKNGALYYRSGGGITSQSIANDEFRELTDKIYVPTA